MSGRLIRQAETPKATLLGERTMAMAVSWPSRLTLLWETQVQKAQVQFMAMLSIDLNSLIELKRVENAGFGECSRFTLSESEAKRKLKMLLHSVNISAEILAETGGVRSVVALIADVVGAKLLVVCRGSDRRAEGSLGAHVYELVRRSPCPVVFCPRGRESRICFWKEWQQEGSQWEPDSLLISSRLGEVPDLHPVRQILGFSDSVNATEGPATGLPALTEFTRR
jgi:hypothetical protein